MLKIALLKQRALKHSYETYMAKELACAFARLNISTQEVVLSNPSDVTKLGHDRPSLTLSFDNILFPELERPFCDMLGIPHAHWGIGSLIASFPYLSSKKGTILVKDPLLADTFDQPFLPDAVPTDVMAEASGLRPFDVVVFANLVDADELKRRWHEVFDAKSVTWLLDRADDTRFPLTTFKTNPPELLHELEELQKAQRAQALIQSLKNVRVDVFGNHQGKNWVKKLQCPQNITLHGPLPFSIKLELLKKTKLLVMDQYDTPSGSDFWFLHALSCGACPMTNSSTYLKKHFKGPFFYAPQNLQTLQESLFTLLENEPKRQAYVQWHQHHTLKHHHFNTRVSELLKRVHFA